MSRRRLRWLPGLLLVTALLSVPLAVLFYEANRRGVSPLDLLFGSSEEEETGAMLPPGAFIDFLSPRTVGRRSARTGEDPPHITHLVARDLDGDGLLDIVACDAHANRIQWVRQHPAGVFTERSLGEEVRAPAHVEVLDFDEDGDLDLLVASLGIVIPSNDRIGAVVLLENDGKLGFTNRVLIDRIARVSDVRAGDLDGDGDLDLAVAQFGYDDGETRWMENRGGGRFESHLLQALSGPINCEIVDLDGDGDPDIVTVVSQEWEEIYVFLNDGKGSFTTRRLLGFSNEDFGSSGIRVADLDRDGDPDIIYTNGDAFDYIPPRPRSWHGVHWLENQGDLKFRDRRLAYFHGAYGALPVDLDADGDLDLVAVSAFNYWGRKESRSMIWLENNGSMEFSRRDLASDPTHLLALDAGDFDGDGWVDLVTGSMCISPPFDRARRLTLWTNRWPEIQRRRRPPAPDEGLPGLPDLSDRSPLLANEITKAHEGVDPEDAVSLESLGRIYHANGFAVRAAALYARAERLDPDGWSLRYHHALALEDLGEVDRLAEKLREVLERREDHGLAWYRLAEAEVKRGRLEAAESAYRRARDLPPPPPRDPSQPRTVTPPLADYAELGLLRIDLERGDPEAVHESLVTLVARQPDFGAARRMLVRVLKRLGRKEEVESLRQEAAAYFRFAPPADPLVDALLRESLSSEVLLRHLGLTPVEYNAPWALFLARRALEVDPDETDAVERLADTLYRLEQYGEALPLYLRHLPDASDPMIVTERVNECFSGLGRHAEAEHWLRERIREQPEEPFLSGLLGTTLFRMGRIEEAAVELSRALEDSENYEFRTTLGACRAMEGRLDEAIADFRRALSGKPRHVPALLNLVTALLATGRHEEAGKPARELVAADPENPNALFLGARAAAATGRVEEAGRLCRAALHLAPDFAPARRLLSELPD